MRQRGWSLPNEASALLFSETFKPPPRAKPLPIFSESADPAVISTTSAPASQRQLLFRRFTLR